jgi:hypothetical protein
MTDWPDHRSFQRSSGPQGYYQSVSSRTVALEPWLPVDAKGREVAGGDR